MIPNQSSARPNKVQSNPTCPVCGHAGINTACQDEAFTYGSGKTAVELKVSVPVRRCEVCDFEYLDESAEKLKHEAICQHLGVLAPMEIRRIRLDHRMTRARFAQITGLGEASLNRWENGLNIQTHANDRYLRLLARPEIMRHLEDLVTSEPSPQTRSVPVEIRFPSLNVNEGLLAEKDSFKLSRAA